MRLFRRKNDERPSIWKRFVGLALTDVRFLAQSRDPSTWHSSTPRAVYIRTRDSWRSSARSSGRVACQTYGAPHELLMVIAATVGQNALSQVRTFHEVLGLTGIVLGKLDATASGGIVGGFRAEHRIPVKLVGLGEAMTDLESFDADAFLDGVFPEE